MEKRSMVSALKSRYTKDGGNIKSIMWLHVCASIINTSSPPSSSLFSHILSCIRSKERYLIVLMPLMLFWIWSRVETLPFCAPPKVDTQALSSFFWLWERAEIVEAMWEMQLLVQVALTLILIIYHGMGTNRFFDIVCDASVLTYYDSYVLSIPSVLWKYSLGKRLITISLIACTHVGRLHCPDAGLCQRPYRHCKKGAAGRRQECP